MRVGFRGSGHSHEALGSSNKKEGRGPPILFVCLGGWLFAEKYPRLEDLPVVGEVRDARRGKDGASLGNGHLHEAAIEELSESFSSEMKPVVLEFEGEQYELTGSAEEQFKQWRKLLRQIYYAETGFEPEPAPEKNESNPSDKPK